MINLITGYNNTGKTTWIANTIGEKLKCDIGFEWTGNSHKVLFDKYKTGNNDWEMFKEGFNHFGNDRQTFAFIYPENGLHPSNQSKLIEQYLEFHNAGYDIYIETHSDHIINAVRVAIKQGLIKCEDVKVLFFKAVDDVVEIEINEKGEMYKTPVGFCDEYDKQLSLLFL